VWPMPTGTVTWISVIDLFISHIIFVVQHRLPLLFCDVCLCNSNRAWQNMLTS
jgi:hypothetical protein